MRKQRHLTQQQLADELHFSRSSVSQWELGNSQPKAEHEKLLADFFHVSIDYLNGNSTFAKYEETMNLRFTPKATYREIFDQILSLPEEYHMTVQQLLDALNSLAAEQHQQNPIETNTENQQYR